MARDQETTGQAFADEVTAALAVLLFTNTVEGVPCTVLIRALLAIKEHKGLEAVAGVLQRTIVDLVEITEKVQDELTRQDTCPPPMLH